MKAKIDALHMNITISVFSVWTNLACHSPRLLWQQYICFPQYHSLIIYTQEKMWRNDTTSYLYLPTTSEQNQV